MRRQLVRIIENQRNHTSGAQNNKKKPILRAGARRSIRSIHQRFKKLFKENHPHFKKFLPPDLYAIMEHRKIEPKEQDPVV